MTPLHVRYIKEVYGNLVMGFLWVFSQFSKVIGYRSPYWRFQSYLLQRTHLVDADYYLSNYLDVEQQGYSPSYHFAAFGDKEGRQPNPLFDPRFYKSKARGHLKNVNSLLHYFYCGQYRRYSPSVWFDIQFYIANNRDLLNAGYEPLRHYLEFGGLEGRSPNPQFDGKFYLNQHPEIASSHTNPLIHYLEHGRWHGLPTRNLPDEVWNDFSQKLKITSSKANELNAADTCFQLIIANHSTLLKKRKADHDEAIVDVIIPVYRNTLATLQCIASVLQAQDTTAFQVIVINDASPEKKLIEYLHNLSEIGRAHV